MSFEYKVHCVVMNSCWVRGKFARNFRKSNGQ